MSWMVKGLKDAFYLKYKLKHERLSVKQKLTYWNNIGDRQKREDNNIQKKIR